MVCVAALLLALFAPTKDFQLESPHVLLSFRTDQSIFPREWQTLEIDPVAEPLPVLEEGACVTAIREELRRYPTAVVEKNLKGVFIGQGLRFYGLQYGGTNSLDSLYLSLPGWHDRVLADRFLRRAFHHEFSSILLRNYATRFRQGEWESALPTGFKYSGDGAQSLREGKSSTRYEARYNRQGFLAEYSTSSLEEDFNLFAEAIFCGDPEFWRLYDTFPAIAVKADLVLALYASIDPAMDAKSLRGLAQGPLM